MVIYFLSWFLGASIGSFLLVVVSRWDREGGSWLGRSHCTECHHVLPWYDLIPLVSFVLLHRRCRFCRHPIVWQYLFVEIVCGASFLALVWQRVSLGVIDFPLMIWQLVILTLLWGLLSFDWTYFILPDSWVALLAGAGLVGHLIFASASLMGAVWAGIAGAGLFGILYTASAGQWLGFGDVKLMGALGLALGPLALLMTVFGAVVGGGIVALALLLSGRAKRDSMLPFGSFLAGTAILVIIYYDPLANLIIQYFQ